MRTRDYSLLGPDADRAVAEGLVTMNWYRTPVPKKRMKALMRDLLVLGLFIRGLLTLGALMLGS